MRTTKTIGSDQVLNKDDFLFHQKDFQVQHCSAKISLLNLLNYSRKKILIYNKTLQCFFSFSQFPFFSVASHGSHGVFTYHWDGLVGLNDEIEILRVVSYIFFHWILSSRPHWRYDPGACGNQEIRYLQSQSLGGQ